MKRITTLILLIYLFPGCTNTTETLFKEARKLDSLERYQEAIAIYDKIIAKDPNDIHALFDRAVDKGLIKDHEGEVEDLMRILMLDSTNTLALHNLGITYGNLAQYKESINAFNKAVETKGGEFLTMDYMPNGFVDEDLYMDDVPIADIKLERGIAYYNADSLRKAYFDLTYCIENNHQLKDSYYYRANTYLKSGMLEQACEDLKMAEIYGENDATMTLDKYCR